MSLTGYTRKNILKSKMYILNFVLLGLLIMLYSPCKFSIVCVCVFFFCRNFELPALDSYFDELSDSFPLPYSYTKQLPFTEFQDFEDFPYDFFSMEQAQDFASHFDIDHVVLDQSPVNPTTEFAPSGSELSESSVISQSEYASSGKSEEEKGTSSRRKRTTLLELDEIQKHFDVPITKAAKEMNVGLTVLKKRCRELNIMRWPHRKIKSLNSLIKNVQVRACMSIFGSR